ncbi:trk system potassium uptake protein TrkH [Nitrosomonas sp. Nm51]|uniref:TrkH family potassium uptake protein n=1 Tax=Nitrosomonas sp. Nm51 TaxID=133720 RepID=UPI0008BE20D6|nr:TrkH family potassium uptake protein [Nitrosomonas sp. Nm51]SER72414.1 trk system potassium uptake protein TrkH [Nitrosomonas sp. Nm51]
MPLHDHTALLQKPVRLGVVGKYLGQLLLVMAVLAIIPLAASLIFMEYHLTLRYIIVEIILLTTGLPLMRISASTDIQTNEGLVITGLIFILSPLIMTIPVMGSGLNFIDALFETVSAFTTTGLSVATQLQQQPQTFLFARTYMQWIGGLGIVILTIALLLRPGAYIRKLIELDESSDFVSSARMYARRILTIYIVLTGICTGLIWMADGNFFNAITHAFSAVSTGGFSNFDNSLAGFHSPFGAISVILGCIFGALPLLLYFHIRQHSFLMIYRDVQVRTIVFLFLFISLALTWVLLHDSQMTFREAVFHAPLMAISAQTTAGFASLDVTQIGAHGMLILMMAMFTGGALGSTAGGIKLYRMLIFWQALSFMLKKATVTPHAVILPRLAGKNLETDEINRALLVILLFIFTITCAWLVFLFSGYEPLAALFEVVSATATVGLSSGITDIDLSPHLKLTLCLCMLLGRLEFFALLVLVYPSTWTNRRS